MKNVLLILGILFPLFCTATECNTNIKEIVISKEGLKTYKHTYTSPDVQYLREAFDSYLSGKMGSGASSEKEYEPLKKYELAYYKSKFIVLAINQDAIGQWVIDILFQDRPDKVFTAVTYDGFELREFSDKNLPVCDIERLKIMYRKLIKSKELSL